jgi:hypothetical protein
MELAADALLVPSAALQGADLVILPRNLPEHWSAEVITSQDMPIMLPDG